MSLPLITSLLLLLLLGTNGVNGIPLLVPVLPLSVSYDNNWPIQGSAVCGDGAAAHCGDVRAVISLSQTDIINNSTATVQIFWRRRDPNPSIKGLIVTDYQGTGGFTVSSSTILSDCGFVTFTRSNKLTPGVYYIYYLPYSQGGGGAGLQFSWGSCTNQDPTEANQCVGGRRRQLLMEEAVHVEDSVCLNVTVAAASTVLGLENRDSFNAFTDMEMMATAEETALAAAALSSSSLFVGVFPEDSNHSVRVFDAGIPARWILQSDSTPPSFTANAAPGQYLTFQIGLWAFKTSAVSNVSALASTLTGPSGTLIDASALTVLNLQGSDVNGVDFLNTMYSLNSGEVGSLWVGLSVPTDASSGTYVGTLTLSATEATSPISISLSFNINGAIIPFGNAGDINSMARLQWLNSKLGIEDVVPAPFVPVTANISTQGILTSVTSFQKLVMLAGNGLPSIINIDFQRERKGLPQTTTHSLLRSPVTFDLFDSSSKIPLTAIITIPANVTSLTNSSVSWNSAWTVTTNQGEVVTVSLVGELDFTSTLTYAITLSGGAASSITLSDVQLNVLVAPELASAGYIAGMADNGQESERYVDRYWRWSNTTGANKVYLGHPEAGVIMNLKGDGPAWDSPMFGADYPVIPFVPTTWGGLNALPSGNPNGVNITMNGTFCAFSGSRVLSSSSPSSTFRFAIQLLPSKRTNWVNHWATRTQQLGYDIPYASPADVAARGVTVATIHQGTPGIVNNSLINPWINYVFLNDTVPLLTNYTAQSNALGMAVKFYYTVRELSSRAPEMFAFKAMQGELLVDEDPYKIVQPGELLNVMIPRAQRLKEHATLHNFNIN